MNKPSPDWPATDKIIENHPTQAELNPDYKDAYTLAVIEISALKEELADARHKLYDARCRIAYLKAKMKRKAVKAALKNLTLEIAENKSKGWSLYD